MGLSGLLRRELSWWARSIGVLWAVPVGLLVISCFPAKLLFFVDVDYLESQWRLLAAVARGYLGQEVLGISLGSVMQMSAEGQRVDALLRMEPADLWRTYICPFLQLWGMVVLPIFIAPLAIAGFNRDRQSGLFLAHRMAGGGAFPFLLAKKLAMGLHLLWMQALAYITFMLFFQRAAGHPELFRLTDPLWLASWLGCGLGLGMLAVSTSWVTCLLTRNNQSEIYNAMLVGSLFTVFAMLLLSRGGWSLAEACAVTAGSLLASLALDALIARRMGREGFVLR